MTHSARAHAPGNWPDPAEIPWRDLRPLMQPRTVAVVGASQREARGNIVLRNLIGLGFPGGTFPINPKYTEVLGLHCYPDLSATPEPVDCVVVAIPARNIPDLLTSAADLGVRAAVILSSGFAEAGPEGQARQAQLEALSRERGLLVCGPNCWGVFNVPARAAVFSSPIPPGFPAGDVALLSQSGALSLAIANSLAENHGVGFSFIVSCGNQAGVTVEEYLNHFVEDDGTRVIAAFVEGLRRPQGFLAVARKALERNKPIVIMKVGRSEGGRRATLAHSGSLAGEAEVVEAAFRQCGVVQVRSLNEMVETLNLFSCPSVRERYAGGRRIGMLTGAGGECSHVADLADEMGLDLPDLAEATKAALRQVMPDFAIPRNPLDGTGAMYEDPKVFPLLLQGLVDDPNMDLVAVNMTANDFRPTVRANNRRFAAEIAQIAGGAAKPVIVFGSVVGGALDPDIVPPMRAAGVPFVQGTDFALAAFRNLARHHEFRRTARPEPAPPERVLTPPPFPELAPGVLAGPAAFRLVEAFGIPVAPRVLAHTADEAVAAATRIGFPVALKVESPAIQHKSDVGGVALGVATPDAVRAAFHQIQREVAARAPGAEIAGVLVQAMAPPGVEVILGVKRDPLFGPVIVCGLGGIFVEVLKDVVTGIPPLSPEEARDLLRRLRGWPILEGARGRPSADVDALSNAVASLSALAVALRDRIVALDINPLIVYPEGKGVLAVDALVEVE